VSTILLLPLGNVDLNLVEALRFPLKDAFGLPVKTAESTIHLERFYDANRGQYNSTEILLYLKDHYLRESNTCDKILALLSEDLFIPILTFVFGEAELGGSVAVASYHRLQSERYGLPPDHDLLVDRLRKEALHGTSFCATCMRTISVIL
jgi:archaemetzincin